MKTVHSSLPYCPDCTLIHTLRAASWRATMVAPNHSAQRCISGPDVVSQRPSVGACLPSPSNRDASRLSTSSPAKSLSPPQSESMCRYVLGYSQMPQPNFWLVGRCIGGGGLGQAAWQWSLITTCSCNAQVAQCFVCHYLHALGDAYESYAKLQLQHPCLLPCMLCLTGLHPVR